MSRVALFIDGAYLARVLKDECGLARIDYGKLAAAMSEPRSRFP